jgi:phosphatidylglycerol:prolipoprotein diacylglycerol transferase
MDINEISFPRLGLHFNIDSTAFSIFGIDIQWYGICISVGILLAFWFASVNLKKVGISADKCFTPIIVGLIGAIIGARTYYVVWSFDDYKDNLIDVFNIREGGLGFYGGLIGALLFGLIAAKICKVRILPLLDIVGMGFLIGQSIGRWGNFFNQEAFGSNTNSIFGMTGGGIQEKIINSMPALDPDVPVHPCFLYESVWCLLGFIILFITLKKFRKFDGQLFVMYIGWYGLGRAFIEYFRSDSLYAGTIKISQFIAIICFVASVIILVCALSYVKRMGSDYVLYKDTLESKEILAKEQKVFVNKVEDSEENSEEETKEEH